MEERQQEKVLFGIATVFPYTAKVASGRTRGGTRRRDDLLHAFVQAFHKSSTDVRGVVIDIPMYVVCGTEWDRQSYLDMASGRNAEKQIISHVKLLKKRKRERE